MRCYFDNDIIGKLAACDLVEETLGCLGIDWSVVYALATARYKFGVGNEKRARSSIQRYGAETYGRLAEFIEKAQRLEQADPGIVALFEDAVTIDAGEAVLFAAASQEATARVFTGDKRSLHGLAGMTGIDSVLTSLGGRILCFEQVILKHIDHIGFEAVRSKVVPARACDMALRVAFGSGQRSTEQNVRDALEHYITELTPTGLLATI